MHLARPLCSLLLGLGLLLAGCGGGDDPKLPAELPDAGTPDAGTQLTLTRTMRYLTPAGEVVRAEALQAPVELLVPGDAGYTRMAVTEDAVGHAVVRDVPSAPLLVRTGKSYVLTTAAALELGETRTERPDTLRTQVFSAPATVSATGLQPWNESPSRPSHTGTGAEDELRILSPETGAIGDLDLRTDPATGTTALDGASATFRSFNSTIPQLGASRDTLQVMQLTLREGHMAADALMHYTAIRKAATVPAPDFTGTEPFAVSAAVQDVAQQPFAFDLAGLAFGALAAEVHPLAEHNNTSVELYPGALAEQNGPLGFRSPLLQYLQTTPTDVAAPVEFGNPFPASWGQVGQAAAVYLTRVELPTGKVARISTSVFVEDTAARLGSGPMRPVVTPPRSLRVDGAAATQPLTLASRTPVLAWEAPSTGTPTHYELIVYRLLPDTGSSTVVAQLRLPADTRTLRLPDGILETGTHYAVSVGAHVAPAWAQRPLAEAFPRAGAEALTGRLTAP